MVEVYYNGRTRVMMGHLVVGEDGFLRYQKYDGHYIICVAPCESKMEWYPHD